MQKQYLIFSIASSIISLFAVIFVGRALTTDRAFKNNAMNFMKKLRTFTKKQIGIWRGLDKIVILILDKSNNCLYQNFFLDLIYQYYI